MVVELVRATVTRPAMLRVVLDHPDADVALVAQLTFNVLHSFEVVLVEALVVDCFISWVAHCGEVPVRHQHDEDDRVDSEVDY